MRKKAVDAGGVDTHVRFAIWAASHRTLLRIRKTDAAREIANRWDVSMPTGYRWLSVWRNACPLKPVGANT